MMQKVFVLLCLMSGLLLSCTPGWGLTDAEVEIPDRGGTANTGIGQAGGSSTANLAIKPKTVTRYNIHSSSITAQDDTVILWKLTTPSGEAASKPAESHVYQVVISPSGVNKPVGVTIDGKLVPKTPSGGGGELPTFTTNVMHVDLDADTDNTGSIFP